MKNDAAGSYAYDAFIKDQLEQELAKKGSIEQRGLFVITTAGTLVTALFGLVALTSGKKGFVPPTSASGNLRVALVLLVLAAIAAILTNAPLLYSEADPTDLQDAVDNLWTDSSAEATRMTSATRIAFIRQAQRMNSIKAWLLITAVSLEVGAVAFVGLAMSRILEP